MIDLRLQEDLTIKQVRIETLTMLRSVQGEKVFTLKEDARFFQKW